MKHGKHAAISCILAVVLLLSPVFSALPGFAEDMGDPAVCEHDFANATLLWTGMATGDANDKNSFVPETVTLTLLCANCKGTADGGAYSKTFQWADVQESSSAYGGQLTCADGKATHFLTFTGKVELTDEDQAPATGTYEVTAEDPGVIYYQTIGNSHVYDPEDTGSAVYKWSEDGKTLTEFGLSCTNVLTNPTSSDSSKCGFVEQYVTVDEDMVSYQTVRLLDPTCTAIGYEIVIASVEYNGKTYTDQWLYNDAVIKEMIYDEERNVLDPAEWSFLQNQPGSWSVAEVPMVPHTPGADATCTTDQTCTVCGAVLVQAFGHTAGDEPTCTEPQRCTVCGAEMKPANGHEAIGDWIIDHDSDCTNPGMKYKACANCDEHAEEEVIQPKGHTEGAPATCTEPQKCTECGAILHAALGHTPGDKETCTTDQTCTVCGAVLKERTGHTPGDKETCTTDQTCTVCGAVLKERTGHTATGDWIYAPDSTCSSKGMRYKACANCDGHAVEEIVDEKPHTPGAPATCTEPQTCTECGAQLAPATGHTEGASATCTEPQKCTVCGEVLQAALGHTPGDEATCTTAQTCTVCGAEIVKAKGHTPEIVWGKSATCTESGLSNWTKCKVCGETLIPQTTIAPLGHLTLGWEVVKKPTQDAPGLRQKTCLICDKVVATEEMDPLPAHCDCACHEDNMYTRIIRYLFTILSNIFGVDVKCCEDMVPYTGSISSLT